MSTARPSSWAPGVSAPSAWGDLTLRALDRWRLSAFKVVLQNRALARLVAPRSTRLAIQSALHALLAGVLAVYFPVLLFVLAPVLLGAAHVAADVRYLVLRRSLARWWRTTVLVACVALVVVQGLALLRLGKLPPRAELTFVASWALAGVVGAAHEAKAWRRGSVGVVLVLVVLAAALAFPRGFRLLFAHLHNLVALLVWPRFFRRRPVVLAALRLPILGAALLFASGAFYRVSLASPGARQLGVHVLDLASSLSPFARADLAIGATSAFVFLQAVHYAIWLNVVPQGEQPGEGTLTFRRSVRELTADFGGFGVCIVLLAAGGVLCLAFVNPLRATTSYMTLALFHGYLELVLLLYFWVRGCRLDGASGRARAAS